VPLALASDFRHQAVDALDAHRRFSRKAKSGPLPRLKARPRLGSMVIYSLAPPISLFRSWQRDHERSEFRVMIAAGDVHSRGIGSRGSPWRNRFEDSCSRQTARGLKPYGAMSGPSTPTAPISIWLCRWPDSISTTATWPIWTTSNTAAGEVRVQRRDRRGVGGHSVARRVHRLGAHVSRALVVFRMSWSFYAIPAKRWCCPR